MEDKSKTKMKTKQQNKPKKYQHIFRHKRMMRTWDELFPMLL